MRIHAHAAVITAFAPLMLFQSPTTSVFTDTKVSTTIETKHVNETLNSKTNSENHSEETKKVAEKPTKVTETVQSGDSLSLIASAHHTTWVRLYNANKQVSDPNIIHPGQKLVIPSSTEKLPNRYANLTKTQVATMPVVSASDVSYAATPQNSGTGVAPTQLGGDNTYTYHTCTWYVKEMRPDISNHWGNAGYNWIAEAQADGYSTGSLPSAGAIAVTGGHVAYVTGTSNNRHTVTISEMNYAGYPGVHTRTVPASEFQYIY